MNIALMSHDHKKELMVQFCIAYCGVLSKHTVCATNTTGRLVAEATGLPVRLFLSHAHGGSQQIGARIAYNEIDMVLFFSDPQSSDLDPDLKYINQMCDQYNIPFATNAATAEILIHGLERFKIRVNNRKILTGFYAMQGLAEQSGEIMRTVDKLDKIGPEKVRALLIEGGVAEAAADEILKFIAITGENEEVLAALEGYRGRDPIFDQGLDELGTVVKYLGSFGVPADHFAVDLTIARGLDYYTGTVYETVMLDHPEIGSICSGGRYDNLAEYYTDKKLPGVGISIGLTRLFYVLGEQGYLNDDLVTAPADALILPMTEDLSAAIAFATQLRQAGVRAQVYGEQKKFKGKMSYADKLKIPYVVFLGEDEIKSGVVKIKNMTTGDQQALSPAEAVQTIADAMAQRAAGKPIREKD